MEMNGFSSAGGLPKAAHGRTQRSAKTRRSLNPARFVFADRCVRPRRVAPPAEPDGPPRRRSRGNELARYPCRGVINFANFAFCILSVSVPLCLCGS